MEPKPVFFETPEQLRAWFDQHADSQTELWVGFRRKATGLATVSWSEAVDEALCVGWIDGIRQSAGADGYTIRFTPRRPDSTWSEVNVARVAALAAEGRMRPAGLAAFERRDPARTGLYSYEARHRGLDEESEAVVRSNAAAWAFFSAQPPSYRQVAAHWVMSARQPATRERRLAQLLDDSANGLRIAPLRRAGDDAGGNDRPGSDR